MDEIVHGLDLTEEICEANTKAILDVLGITENDISNVDIDD